MRSSITDMGTPSPTRIPLTDAVTLYAIQTDRFKTARLSIYTMSPATPEDAPLETLLFSILRRGTRKFPRLALLNRRLDELYGTTLTLRNYLRGDDHVLGLTVEMLDDAYVLSKEEPPILEGTLELLAEMLLHPVTDEMGRLCAETVAAEKKALVDSIRAETNDPRSYAATRLRCTMCEGEPFGISLSGCIPEIEAVTSEMITALFRKRLASACWEVYYVGSAAPLRVADAFKTAFEGFTPMALSLCPPVPHAIPTSPRYVTEELPVGQGKLCIAWSTEITDATPVEEGYDGYAAAVVLCELLGIMQSSLLFRHVRETLGLCYYCDAAFEGSKGILSVSSGIHPDNRQAAEDAILQVMSDIRQGCLSPSDVVLAKQSIENSYRQLPDSPAAMEAYWFRRNGKKNTPPEAHLARFLSVTVEDVVRVSRQFFLDTVYYLNATKANGEVDEDEA